MSPSQIASLLGQLGRGKKKTLSQAERNRKRLRLAKVRKLRWKQRRAAA